MLCRVADLLVEVPEVGDLPLRCRPYLTGETGTPDIILRADRFRTHRYPPNTSEALVAYVESGAWFSAELLNHGGIYIHSSALVLDGRAYLFSAHSGGGKSTHARVWQDIFPDARVINDDKPALRRLDGTWYAYGTPWCGKDGINLNARAPVAGICFLKKARENRIRRLSPAEAMERLMAQTIHLFPNAAMLDRMLTLLESLLREIPVYELENRPEPEAALLSYETMRRGAQERNL